MSSRVDNTGMSKSATTAKTARQYKFDIGDWIAIRDDRGEYRLVGKIVDADSESCTVIRRDGTRDQFIPESDPIVHVKWRNHQWSVR